MCVYHMVKWSNDYTNGAIVRKKNGLFSIQFARCENGKKRTRNNIYAIHEAVEGKTNSNKENQI